MDWQCVLVVVVVGGALGSLLAWSLCRAGAEADRRIQKLKEGKDGETDD
jgi:hypothetical protein